MNQKASMRILILGGYGSFGGRLVELLEDEARLTLLVAGRSLENARTYCERRGSAKATLVPTLFDRINARPAELTALSPALLVDASGPFQGYGCEPYRLIEMCIQCRVNYLDLADGSVFVGGVGRFDDAARGAGVYVLSGVSSFPVLTAAVVRHLSSGIAHIDTIRGGIAPSPYAGVGMNVIRAIASYAGQPIALRRGGRTVTGFPITESMRFVIAPPGRIPLKSIRFSLVDVPDLHALVEIWPVVRNVWMGAGPVPAILHRLLTAFAWLVRLRLMPNLSWMAPAIFFVIKHVRWGEHRGGMFVEVVGRGADECPIRRSWHLLAEGSDGPLIPSMAIEAIVRKSLAERAPAPGARTAIQDVDLSDYEKLFARRTIFTGVRQPEPVHPLALFRRILGSSSEILPPAIQALHSPRDTSRFSGRCTVRLGINPLTRLIAAVVGFPKRGEDVPISVTLSANAAGEHWIRSIRGRTFSSDQLEGTGRSEGLLRERFGPMDVDMALVAASQGLTYVIRRWSLLGLSLPLWLGPRTLASEFIDSDGRFSFDVKLTHPFVGLLVHYAGWLTPTSSS